MKCPECRANDAYVGLSSIECPNPFCRHFSTKVAQQLGPVITFSFDVKFHEPLAFIPIVLDLGPGA